MQDLSFPVISNFCKVLGDYVSYYQNIYDAISKDVPLLVTAEEARNAIRVIELAILSSQEKRTIDFTMR